MGKVRAINPEEEALKVQEKAAKEAERLAKIEAEKTAGKAKRTEEKAPIITGETDGIRTEKKENKKVSKYAAKQASNKRQRSEKYETAAKLIDKSKFYDVKQALTLVEKAHLASFDETVELHINTTAPNLSGQVILPHGTGKNIRVAILQPNKDAAGADLLLKEIEAGKINFDILVATPDAMSRLAKVARILGPRGLMPNPKNGTVSTNPEAVAKQYAGGQMYYKTEPKMAVMHVAVGKLSFGQEKLSENIKAMLKAIKMENIKKVVVKSTMSPAVRLQLGK